MLAFSATVASTIGGSKQNVISKGVVSSKATSGDMGEIYEDTSDEVNLACLSHALACGTPVAMMVWHNRYFHFCIGIMELHAYGGVCVYVCACARGEIWLLLLVWNS